MDEQKLRALLESVREGKVDVEGAAKQLRDLPFTDLGYAMVDHHRALRQGVPEVIFGEGKSSEQIVGIATSIVEHGSTCLVTRVAAEKARHVLEVFPDARHVAIARTITIARSPIPKRGSGPVAIVAAGTSDLPVAEEACETLAALGRDVIRMYDVGVSGIHRILMRREELSRAVAIIVCAGMEGALPSVVGGLTDRPVIGVPTSIGYGTAFNGLTPLMAMLTSCASGVTVVNIDNGFGAAFAAARIDRS
ncbi:MAG: nickel pincer cofactor biosynthesis protein LarB [Polyangiales bacterium]